MNPLQQLHALGQSVWLDYIRRDLLESGELARLIESGEVRGVTSNPTIFQQAIADSTLYDETARPLAQAGLSSQQIFEALAVEDIRAATDLFLPLYERTGGADGFVSIEVSPRLAYDTQGTVEEARRLWSEVNRPNVMIKIPATEPGLPAIEQSISEGINVNVTLVFSLIRYNQVMQAYLRGLERRQQQGVSLDHVASVASFFVSRVDTLVDARLEQFLRGEGPRAPRAAALMGKAAIANAKLAYAQFKGFFDDPRFELLRQHGAQLQRPLWASTSTKNPAYRDVVYVETLIGPHTVNTLPPATLEAFREHGVAQPTIEHSLSEARAQLDALQELGISMEEVTGQLETDGVGKFAGSFEALLATLETRAEQFRAELGSLGPTYGQAIQRLGDERIGPRLWERDETLWPGASETDGSGQAWFDWLDQPTTVRQGLDGLRSHLKGARERGVRTLGWIGSGRDRGLDEVLLGLPTREAEFELAVLEGLDAAAARKFAKATPGGSSVFVVESSNMPVVAVQAGLEPTWQRVQAALGEQAGAAFLALAEADSELGRIAAERGFDAIVNAPPAPTGPFGALSAGSLAPAQVAGLEVEALLAGAAQMARAAGPAVGPTRNPALALAGFLASAGGPPIQILADQEMRPFARWLAQALRDGLDLAVVTQSDGQPTAEAGAFIDLRRSAGHDGAAPHGDVPTFVMPIDGSPRAVGASIFRLQFGLAAAGATLGRDPFRRFERAWSSERLKRGLEAARRRGEGDLPHARQLPGGISVWPEKRWDRLAQDAGLAGVAEALLAGLPPAGGVRLSLYPESGHSPQLDRLQEVMAARRTRHSAVASGLEAGGRGDEAALTTLQLLLEPRDDGEVAGLGLSYGALNRLLAAAEFEARQARREFVVGIALPAGTGLRELAAALQAVDG